MLPPSACALQVWKLSSADLCEVARNGVLHSGFPHSCKKHWVAEEYWRPGPDGNDIQKTNVPNLRMRFRWDQLLLLLPVYISFARYSSVSASMDCCCALVYCSGPIAQQQRSRASVASRQQGSNPPHHHHHPQVRHLPGRAEDHRQRRGGPQRQEAGAGSA